MNKKILFIPLLAFLILNGFIACVNIYFLAKMQKEKKTEAMKAAKA